MSLYILSLPLISAIICGLFNKILSHIQAWLLTTIPMCISAILSCILFYNIVQTSAIEHIVIAPWIHSGNLQANWALYIDKLTAIMFVVVTSVSSLVHIYSYGYMNEDKNLPKFMSYLSLFTFGMLALVSSDNFLQLFFGWESVGLCSYLLIGFWHEKDSASLASMKAFVVNRVGDFGLALGVFLIYHVFDTVSFQDVFANLEKGQNLFAYGLTQIDVICLLLFIGCMGKSAQIGLHIWLPDAMEGPTPVSALIHAATMVTAGVFLLARCSYMYECSQVTLNLIIIVGMVTSLFAATIALTQTDIKKIIAYSTCSQLGYMFFACGVSAYNVAIFHLATHAFFKALLFLCAGSVIHAMHHEQDITKMGGLYKKIPQTYALFMIGSLAIMGIYPFAGYYSKDLILESAYMSTNSLGFISYIFGLLTAFLTAFYSVRLLILVFHGHDSHNHHHEIYESPKSMMIPLYILAIGAVFSGMFGIYIDIDQEFFANIISSRNLDHHHVPLFVVLSPTIAALSGLALAYLIYQHLHIQEYIFLEKILFMNLNFIIIYMKI